MTALKNPEQIDMSGESSAVTDMMAMLRDVGHENFHESRAWEKSLCTLVTALAPRCKTYRFLEALPHHDGALNEIDTLNTLAHLGFFARPIKAKLSELDTRLLPALFVPDGKEPVVILDAGDDKIKMISNRPMQQLAQLPDTEGTIWLFNRFDEQKSPLSKFMREGTGHSWFRALVGRFRGTFSQILLAGFILNFVTLFTPIFTMLVYDRVIASGGVDTLPMLTLGALMAVAFEWALRRVRSMGLSWFAARLDNVVSNRIFSHLIGLPPEMVERASVSSQIARIKTFESIRDFFSSSVFLSLIELPFVAISALAIYAIAGPLVLVPLGMIACYGILFYMTQRKVKVTIRLAAKATSAKQQFAIEAFEKITGIRGYGLTARWQEKYRDLSGREMMAHFRLNFQGVIAETMASALTVIAAITTISFGVYMIWNGMMSTGALVATMILVWRVLTPFYSMCTMVPRLEQIRNSIIQVNKLMDLDTEQMSAKASAQLQKINGTVNFADTGIQYSEDTDPVFMHMNFNAKPGEITVIMGENGSGKTTFLKMLKGLYRPQSGAIQLDGFDTRQLDATELRRQIAYVPQNPDIFRGSVMENLRISNPLATETDMQVALELADAWQDVQAMPQGLNTIISRHGADAISVNLATRLSLARAYLHPAQVLLIDEISNTILNGTAGKNLKDYLLRIKGKRTAFMVTYREDFTAIADKILLLQHGETPQVVARGADQNFPIQKPSSSKQQEVA